MPVKIHKITRGKNKGKFRVRRGKRIIAKATTKRKAQRQARLLRAIDRGWRPTRRRKRKK